MAALVRHGRRGRRWGAGPLSDRAAPSSAHWPPLCRLDEVPDGGSAAFTIEGDDEPRPLMVIRHGTRVRVYVNACPHIGLTVDMVPGRFLNREKTHILCANHGALFRVEDGDCVAGPCLGRRLTAVRVAVCEGLVRVAPGETAASCVGS